MQISMNDVSFYLTLVYSSSQIALTGEKTVLQVMEQEIVFLVPDSCRATVKNGNNVSANLTEDAIETDQNNCCFMLFSDNLVVVLELLILQDKHDIPTLSMK